MSDTLREELTRRNEEIQQIPDPLHPEFSKLPAELNVYHTICPLEPGVEPPSKVFGCKTGSYKATSSVDGKPYYIRRIEGTLSPVIYEL